MNPAVVIPEPGKLVIDGEVVDTFQFVRCRELRFVEADDGSDSAASVVVLLCNEKTASFGSS